MMTETESCDSLLYAETFITAALTLVYLFTVAYELTLAPIVSLFAIIQ